MERLTSPFRLQRRWNKPKYNSDQQSALVVLHEYLKARQLSKEMSYLTPDSTPPSGYSKDKPPTLRPVESLRRLLPRRKSRAVTRSPVLTNGILIRNKQGELIHPPTPTAPSRLSGLTKHPKKITSMRAQIPQSPCSLKSLGVSRKWQVSGRLDDVPLKEARNLTAELSAAEYSKDPDTFYVKDILKDLPASPLKPATSLPVPASPQPAEEMASPARCHVSMISKASELTMREQPSALCNSPGAGVLHSTLNYPLHSTMMPESLPKLDDTTSDSDSDCDSSSLSFDVDPTMSLQAAPQSVQGNCDVCHALRRQVGQLHLIPQTTASHPQRHLPQAITQSDLHHDRTLVNDSLNVTRGSDVDLSEVTLVNASISANCGTPRMGVKVTLKRRYEESSCSPLLSADFVKKLGRCKSGNLSGCPDCSHCSKRSKLSIAQCSSASSSSSLESSKPNSSSSINLSKERRKELSKKLKQFNKSVNSDRRNLEITTLGVF